jgi:hypothetical protein
MSVFSLVEGTQMWYNAAREVTRMNARKKFHVDHAVRPAHVTAILQQLSPFVGDVRSELLTALTASGHEINPHYLFWNLKTLRALGLVDADEQTESWKLTRRGAYLRALAEWNPRTFYDMMHYLYYTSWNFGDPDSVTFSWTYQTVCNLLWQRRPTVIDGKALATEVRTLAQQQFGLAEVSITDYAIDGVYNWVRILDPAFAWTDLKTRRRETNGGRSGCTPELFMMAVDYLYRMQGTAYGRPILMDEERATIVCRLCLLEPLKWKGVLNRGIEQFSILHRAASASGPQVTLDRAPRLIIWPGEADVEPVDTDIIAKSVSHADDDDLDEDDEDDDEE